MSEPTDLPVVRPVEPTSEPVVEPSPEFTATPAPEPPEPHPVVEYTIQPQPTLAETGPTDALWGLFWFSVALVVAGVVVVAVRWFR